MTIKYLQTLLLVGLVTVGVSAHAEVTTEQPQANASTPLSWATNGSSDKVTIENGTGANLNIVITVNDNASTDPAGINVQNCGNTTHIDAGSSAVCVTNDAKNPVTFSSDKEYAATGIYQITQQLPKQ